jgi:peroxiredoxin
LTELRRRGTISGMRTTTQAALAALAGLLLGSPAHADVSIGSKIENLEFKDIRAVRHSLSDFPKASAVVLVFTDTGCPIAQRYLPILEKLQAELKSRGVVFLAINASAGDSIGAMAAQAVRCGCTFPFVKDFGGVCAKALGVTHTPGAVVLDAERKLRYRGRIDDQFRPGGSRPEPSRSDLREAILALLDGKPVSKTETPVDGCPITFAEPPPARALNYAADVAPILKTHCQECHRPGTVAPFSLQSYDQVVRKAKTIAEVVTDGRMPPWHAAPEHTEFVNKRGLSAEDRETLLAWLQTKDLPRGDDKSSPAPLLPAGEWRIGEPDRIIVGAEHMLPATGDVPYQYTVLPTIFAHDTWVQGVEIKPDNPAVLHHCNMAYAKIGEKFHVGNFITGQVPGGTPMSLDHGVAFKIPAGSFLALQIHFVTTGKPETCRISVGLRYARETVQQQLRHIMLVNTRYTIPPGEPAYPISASRELPCDAIGVGLFAHMHVRGKDITFSAKPPDGKEETLLLVPNYSFDWQQPYRWEFGAKKLAKGTRLSCLAHYDNSAFNPYNPDATATVKDGPQTYNEMLNGFVFYVDAKERLGLEIDVKTGVVKKP